MDLEQRVIEEIKEWANQVLDKPNPFLGFHPFDESEEAFDQEFDHLVEEPYTMFFVQRLSTIEKSAEMLREKGYYDQYLNDPETAGLWDERQELYRRLCDAGTKGNEEWYGQEKSQAC
jgi:hypothetical protein